MSEGRSEQAARSELLQSVGPTWIEVNLDHIAWNVMAVRKMVGPDTRILAVVKADAYGHGSLEVAGMALACGADALGVFSVQEAEELRTSGITEPILMLGCPLPEQAEAVVRLNLSCTVHSLVLAGILSDTALEAGRRVKVHLEVDTGMNRFGAHPRDVPDILRRISSLAGIEVEGIYTHFVFSDPRRNRNQLARFMEVVADLEQEGLRPPLVHAANSEGCLLLPESRLDMVRVGNLLYGIAHIPPGVALPSWEFRNAWTLKSTVVQVRAVSRGEGIGYGSEFTASRDMTVAVLPIGLADGFMWDPVRPVGKIRDVLTRMLSAGVHGWRSMSRGGVVLRGREVRLVGRVGMQHCVVDVSRIGGLHEGDVALIRASRIAVSARLPRVYFEDGQPVRVSFPSERRAVAL
ncbi:MAG: alanine racemase [Clostridia bacterium]|nr:alanine racemase [Clostridia bacterium]MDQ7791062.1 alanine racemase [Clostridia bacterium]